MATLILFFLIILSFSASIFFSGKSNKEKNTFIFYAAGICLYILYEISIQHLHSDWNIRSDLILIFPLFVVASVKALSPDRQDASSQTDESKIVSETQTEAELIAARRASRSLYFGLSGIVFYAFPFLSIASIVLGHLALAKNLSKKNRTKAMIGLWAGYLTLLLSVAAWGFIEI